MVLDTQRGLRGEAAAVVGGVLVLRGAHDLRVDLHADAIHKGGDVGGLDDFVPIQLWRGEDDVVGLPFTGLFHRVHERRRLAVDAASHAVGVGRIIVAVEHLALVAIHEEDACVAFLLGVTLRVGLALPLEVYLAAREFLLRPAVTTCDEHFAILDLPWAGAELGGVLAFVVLLFALEGIGAGAIKDDDGVRWRVTKFVAGLHGFRARAVDVVDLPFCAGDDRRVGIADWGRLVVRSEGSSAGQCQGEEEF